MHVKRVQLPLSLRFKSLLHFISIIEYIIEAQHYQVQSLQEYGHNAFS